MTRDQLEHAMQSGRHVKSPKIQRYGYLARKQSSENSRMHRKNFGLLSRWMSNQRIDLIKSTQSMGH
jgi:hypothetical protein